VAKTQYYTATSIDGFIADQDNSLDWLFAVDEGREDETGPNPFAFADAGLLDELTLGLAATSGLPLLGLVKALGDLGGLVFR
jgi:hypothetical protein